jgi:hypothetical protein
MNRLAKSSGFGTLCVLGLLALHQAATAGKINAQALRLVGPDVLHRDGRTCVRVEGLVDGKTWKLLEPGQFSVKVAGDGALLDDPSGDAMNPFELRAAEVDAGKIAVEVRAGDRSANHTIRVGTPTPVGVWEGTVSPNQTAHRFSGFGGGVLFYDNQFDVTTREDIVDWCFRDVNTTFLHILIRPGYQAERDPRDWRIVDLDKYDFKTLERPLRIIQQARERNRNLKLYASIYSAPAWMKTNGATGGVGSLKDGLAWRQELARYVFAYLKHLHQHGLAIDYLAFFNEPDFPHEQDGMHFADLGVLADTFADCATAVDQLIAKDVDIKKSPVYVFPDTLGAGSITRAGANSKKLQARTKQLTRVGVWGVHDYWNQTGTYWNDRFRELRSFPGVAGKPIWMTEWAQRFRRGDLASGVEYGSNMLNAVQLGAEAWMVFEWCHPGGNQAGLISTLWNAKTRRYWRSKAYFVFRQIANTTPADSIVVPMKGAAKAPGKALNLEHLAVKHGEDITFHLMNAEAAPVSYRVKVSGKSVKATGYLTTPDSDMTEAGPKAVALKTEAGAITVAGVVPAYSLLSVTLPGAAAKKKTP